MIIYTQAQCFKNLAAVLEEAGSSMKNVVRVGVFLTDMANFAAMNKVSGWMHLYTLLYIPDPLPNLTKSRYMRPSLRIPSQYVAFMSFQQSSTRIGRTEYVNNGPLPVSNMCSRQRTSYANRCRD